MFSNYNLFKEVIKFSLISITTFGTFFLARGQEEINNEVFFREDQFYLGTSFMVLSSDQEDFNPRGLSRHFQWGFIRDLPLNSSGKLAIGMGLGMSFERYNTNLNLDKTKDNSVNYFIADQSASPVFFSIHSVEIPLTLRWRNATLDNFAFWRVYGGVSLRWNYYNKIRQEIFEIKNSNDIDNFGAVAHVSFGYNTWNFYLGYNLNSFFSKMTSDFNRLPIELNPIKIGLIFYIL